VRTNALTDGWIGTTSLSCRCVHLAKMRFVLSLLLCSIPWSSVPQTFSLVAHPNLSKKHDGKRQNSLHEQAVRNYAWP
jgi:hypothetical protein